MTITVVTRQKQNRHCSSQCVKAKKKNKIATREEKYTFKYRAFDTVFLPVCGSLKDQLNLQEDRRHMPVSCGQRQLCMLTSSLAKP